jgi:putative transcriptional regulator
MNSYQGHFLVATPHQLDPNFVKTVILVVDHHPRGAFGVIVNDARAMRSLLRLGSVGRRFSERFRPAYGGPVTGPLMAVHMNESSGERQLLPGVFFSGKRKVVLKLIWQTEQPCKVFIGYAGWGPRQLDFEVERGMWRVVPATPEQIFSETDDLWERLSWQASRRQLRSLFHIRHIPAYPGLN